MAGINEARTQAENAVIKPLTFTLRNVGTCTISMVAQGSAPEVSLEYSMDNGVSWTPFIVGETEIILNTDSDTASLRASRPNACISVGEADGNRFVLTGDDVFDLVDVSGNINALLNADLPIDALPLGCFSNLFLSCGPIFDASGLEFPATMLAPSCYSGLFDGCGNLTIPPPELPATTLAEGCYSYMFLGCVGLVMPPKLPATTLAKSCYSSMFLGCAGLVDAPELPATTLAEGCYSHMFANAAFYGKLPVLPATTLAPDCYRGMFAGNSLTKAPELPATTLAEGCYASMFSGCTFLAEAPVLPATTQVLWCYTNMFRDCVQLHRLVVGFRDWNAGIGTEDWLTGVPAGVPGIGEFHSCCILPQVFGPGYIPTGWTPVLDFCDYAFTPGTQEHAACLLNCTCCDPALKTACDAAGGTFDAENCTCSCGCEDENDKVTACILSGGIWSHQLCSCLCEEPTHQSGCICTCCDEGDLKTRCEAIGGRFNSQKCQCWGYPVV